MSDGAAMIEGLTGEIRWSYYVAAVVVSYTVVRNIGPRGSRLGWSLRATLVKIDKYKMAQRPLEFVAPIGKGRGIWPLEDFVITPRGELAELTAKLGPVEER